MKDRLSGRIALVTGGSRGIGRAIAEEMARAGADVAVNFRCRRSDAEETCRRITESGRRALSFRADVSEGAEINRMVRTVEKELGTISILVNNAGMAKQQSIETITESDWDRVIAVNLKSQFLLIQAVLPGMRGNHWGRIINLSSAAAQIGGVVGPHYAASKAGVIGLTHACASQLTGEGITVNAIAPALIETEMITADLKVAGPELIPTGRFGDVSEVAGVAVMLAANGYITGQTINVNGGLYMS